MQTLTTLELTTTSLPPSILIRLIPLPPKPPNAPIPTTHIPRIQIIQIPPQTSKPVLSRLEQNIHLPARFFGHPFDISLHIEIGVACTYNRHLGGKELRKRGSPFMR